MRMLVLSVAIAIGQLAALGAYAQTTDDKAAARAERRKEGAEAAKNPLPAEGVDPIPEAKPKISSADKAAARKARRAATAKANKAGQIPVQNY